MRFKYSILIPHKNSYDLLDRCLQSIPHRTDIQIIVVDDNSDNKELKKLFALERENMQLISLKVSGGAGAARNAGLSHVQGEWLIFADSDDFFLKGAFDTIDRETLSESDIIYFTVESRYSDTLKKADRDVLINNLVNNADKSSDYMSLRIKHHVPWGKCFRTEYVKGGRFLFDEIRVANDVFFSLKTGYYAGSVSVCPIPIYCVTLNRGSLINTINKDNHRIRFEVALRYNEFMRLRKLSNYQSSIRPYFFKSLKYGLQECIFALKLINKYGDTLFLDFKPVRSMKNYFRTRRKRRQTERYVNDTTK